MEDESMQLEQRFWDLAKKHADVTARNRILTSALARGDLQILMAIQEREHRRLRRRLARLSERQSEVERGDSERALGRSQMLERAGVTESEFQGYCRRGLSPINFGARQGYSERDVCRLRMFSQMVGLGVSAATSRNLIRDFESEVPALIELLEAAVGKKPLTKPAPR